MAITKQHHLRFGVAFYITAAVVAIGSLVLCAQADPFYAGLSFLPFSFGPLVITAALCVALRTFYAQLVLAMSSLVYAVWFSYVFAHTFYINPDPQSPIAFVFLGIYASPVLAAFWLGAILVYCLTKTKSVDERSTDESILEIREIKPS
ncbi:hypothetical protein [Roseimaritima multifibrata]|uniref:hypothetical protein n=1 Tax=Roseimaritima multifibrata TaxID=1930274 RepID=UPI0011A7E994|nr:hypothetical protein [Roseimaritima multifibrata]